MTQLPTYGHERILQAQGYQVIAGVDEVALSLRPLLFWTQNISP